MPAENNPPTKLSAFKNPTVYTAIILLGIVIYVGWIFFARWKENRDIKRQASEKKIANDRQVVEQMGGRELAIQTFYAVPPNIHRGEKVQLCYGVANAKSVKLEPQDNPVWPSYSRCVEVSPPKDTTYTLNIQDAAGNTKSQSIDVKVR
ncbi:MAG TPA: hypothetical protein VOA64_10735 [Candidatus Dormibacteraeota bacterium]|nr:hypothetical protein [Candidatus Dormibacteraeota bacterium]